MEPEPKMCLNPKCMQPHKTTTDFGPSKQGRNGLKSWCRECENRKGREWRRANRDLAKHAKARRDWNRTRYGFYPGMYEARLEAQKGVCLICRAPLGDRLHADHDHATLTPRGLLCSECNLGLGKFKDDPKLLRRAAAYVQAFQSKHENPHQLLLNLRSIGAF